MNWENLDDLSNEEDKEDSFSQNKTSCTKMQIEEEEIKTLQLKKYQDPTKNTNRQSFIALVNRFGDLLAHNDLEEIINTILADNCECFFFNFLDGDPASYTIGNKHFGELFKGTRIVERKVRETYVDSDRNVVFQISDWRILQADRISMITEAAFELFTISNSKILRYRAGFGYYVPAHGDPFEPIKKDLMLAKVKELNYALADQPNLEKLAELLHEKTEYKILDWDSEKVHTLHKKDIVEGFKCLENHYTLKCIVPYEVYSEREYIIGTYVYHLESKGEPKKEFVWLSTSLYTFDKNINLVQIRQQGDLFPKEDVTIPFEAYNRQKLNEKVNEFIDQIKVNVDLFYNIKVDYHCHIARFGPLDSPYLGTFQGLSEVEKHFNKFKTALMLEWSKAVDIFVDSHDSSYDVAIAMGCSQGMINWEDYRYKGRYINFITITRYCFENGKLAKMCQFHIDIPDPIPSPFEDPQLEGVNIKSRELK